MGIILFEMVTGRLPFEGETPFSIANKQKNEPPPDPRKLNPQIPAELDRVILRSLEKAKEKRYQTTGEFLADLAAVEEALPTGERISARTKPRTSREITVKFTPKKLLVPAAGLIVVAVIAVLLWHPPSHKKGQTVSSGKPSLAVLPFENYSGDASLENWRYGFPELLITGLSSSKYLKVLRSDEVNGVLKKLNLTEGKALTSDDIKKIAREAEVASLLKASFVKAGPNFIISAALVSGQTGETQATLSMKAQTIENILGGGLDGLVKEIKQGLNITEEQIASDIDVQIDKVMTRNPEALKYYVEGERFHLDLKYDEAIASLKKAVELDPEFAMAYRVLGGVYSNQGKYAESKDSYEKAFRFKDRMPPREYYILQGDYYRQSAATYPKAVEMYKKVLDIYPDDYLGNHLLALTYGSLGELELGIEQYSKMLKSRPRDLLIYDNLAVYYSMIGEAEKATQTIRKFVANNPGNDNGHFRLYFYLVLQRRFDLALQELDQAIALCPTKKLQYTLCKGDIPYYKDDLEEAAGFYQTVLDNAKNDEDNLNAILELMSIDFLKGRPDEGLLRWKSRAQQFEKVYPFFFHIYMGSRYVASRTPRLALEEFRKADALGRDYFWQAVAQLEIGDISEAEKLTRKIDSSVPEFMRKNNIDQGSRCYLQGRLALARHDVPDAVKLLDEAVARHPGEHNNDIVELNALYLDSLASACLEMGDADSALKNYEKITLLTLGRACWEDIYARSYYSLGKIYEQKGLKSKAAENYEKFISLWKDCEPRFRPLADDARKRLAALKSS